MHQYNEIQTQFCSSYDKRKLCSYDIEFIEGPTKPIIHQSARFLFMLNGEGILVVDGKEYPIKQNTFVAILPWETTIIKQVDKPLRFIKIIYNSDFVTKIMRNDLNTNNRLIEIVAPIQKNPVLHLSKDEAKTILDVMNIIKSEIGVDSLYDIQEEKELSEIYVTNKLIELLIQFKRFATKKECTNKEGIQIELDNRPAIFKYIYSHLADKITLTRLSDVFFMSESSISKYIGDVTGLTFTDLVNEMRITKVVDILTYTDLSLNDIAMISGFSDAPHLVKVFTSRMDISPNEYRKIYKAKENIFKDKEKSVTFEMINYINNSYTEDIRVTDIAKKFNMTVVEVNRTLMYQLEKNFEEVLHYLRINKACEELLTTNLPIVNIGLDVGYNTVKTFTRNFIRLKGMTPGDFRKTTSLQMGGESIPANDIY